jgi:putative hydrolases of HD superfamily
VPTDRAPDDLGSDAARAIARFARDPDLADRVRFVVELDRLKQVLRRTRLRDGSASPGRPRKLGLLRRRSAKPPPSRRENSAEHSWHVAMMALVLADASAEPVDALHVARLMLVHDIVEIDAGDTFVYDVAGRETQAERERLAADRLFGMLPDPLGAELRGYWEEFEEGTTDEARFARSLDRLQPLLLNYASEGAAWRERGITAAQVRAVNAAISQGSPVLWELAQRVIDEAVAQGWLPESQ